AHRHQTPGISTEIRCVLWQLQLRRAPRGFACAKFAVAASVSDAIGLAFHRNALQFHECHSNLSSTFLLIRIFPFKICPSASFSRKEANRVPESPSGIRLLIFLFSKNSVISVHRNFKVENSFQKTR